MKNEIDDLLIKEFSYIYNEKGEKVQLTLDNLSESISQTPNFFLNNAKYIEEMILIKTEAIKDDFVLDYYQNHSGAVYLCFVSIVSMVYTNLKFILSKEDLEKTMITVLKLLPEILYRSKHNNYFGKGEEDEFGNKKPEEPKSYLVDYQNLPESTRKRFVQASCYFRGLYWGIYRGIFLLSKYDPSIEEKLEILLNPMFDGMMFNIIPIFEPEST